MDFIQSLTQAINICEKMGIALDRGGCANPYCRQFCPTIDGLINALRNLSAEAINIEPECALVLQTELVRLRNPMNNCANPCSFGVVKGILNVLKKKHIDKSNNSKKIFISHSSVDKPIISNFVDRILCLGIGIEANDIFCTSIEEMTMSNGEDIRKHIKDNICSADFSLLMISDNYKNSEVCQNELGAVWAVDNNVRYLMLPNTTFDKIGWLGSPNKAEEINNPVYLDRFQRELKEYYKFGDNPSWSRQRESFIESLRS